MFWPTDALKVVNLVDLNMVGKPCLKSWAIYLRMFKEIFVEKSDLQKCHSVFDKYELQKYYFLNLFYFPWDSSVHKLGSH